MAQSRGEPLSRSNRLYVAAPVATTAALTALNWQQPSRADGCLTAVGDQSLWVYDLDSALAASATVLVPDDAAATGRWVNLIPAGGVAAGSSYKYPVRLATAGALGAYTRVGSVITANAVGALGNVDAVAVVAGDRLLLTPDGTAADADNGIWIATNIGGGAAEYVLTRADDADADGELVGGSIIPVQAGTAFGGEQFFITNAAAITINTTAITMLQIPNYVDLASVAAGEGASLIGIQDVAARFAGAELEAVAADLGARTALAFADTTAQTAYTAAQRADRMIAIVDNDDAGAHADNSLWVFDAAAAGGATDWVRVPDAGTGRWHRVLPTLAELFSVTPAYGADLIGLPDASGLFAAVDVSNALDETALSRSHKQVCRLTPVVALAAYTRVANVITANGNGVIANIDGQVVGIGDRVFLGTVATASDVDNGIYSVTDIGTAGTPFILTRAIDHDADAKVFGGQIVPIVDGAAQAGHRWQITNAAAITVNTTAIAVAELPYVGQQVLATATITSADLATAGVGPETENLGAVVAQEAIITGYRFTLTDAFDNGAGVSLTMEIGHDNDPDAYEDAADVFTGSALEGVGWTYVTVGPGIGAPAFDGTSTGQITAAFTAGADQLANFTNGSVTIEVIGYIMP